MAEAKPNAGKGRLSHSQRKKLMNRKLCRLLFPKNPFMYLEELKPGCRFRVTERGGHFKYEVEHHGTILGKGEAPTKDIARAEAVEDAVERIIMRTMFENSNDDLDENKDVGSQNVEALPWTTIASFALHKLFHQWSKIDDNPPDSVIPEGETVIERVKELPPNALDQHPIAVLTFMHHGIRADELERTENPSRVTMGFDINGKMYTGVASNKKAAKKEAAKTVLKELYGLVYP